MNIENKIRVNINVLKAIIESKNGVADLEKFLKGYMDLYNKFGQFYINEYMNRALEKGKVNKKIKSFYLENKEFIQMTYDKNYYYHITSLFFDKDKISMLIEHLNNVEIKVLKRFIDSMENLNLIEFTFTDSILNIQSCIFINKNPLSKLVEFNTIMTDGDFFLLGRFYNNMYPYYLKNANYIYYIHNKNSIINTLIVNTFDVTLPTRIKYESVLSHIPNFDSKELYERTYFIRSLFELEKIKYEIKFHKSSIENTKKRVEDSVDDLDAVLDMLNKQVKEVNNKIEELEKIASRYGFNDELLKINMDYMKGCQTTLDNDLD